MKHSTMKVKNENTSEKKSLAEFLSAQHYHRVPLHKLATGQLLIEASINNIPGAFILDSGASATVVDEDYIGLFGLNAVIHDEKGAGAGGSGLTVYASSDNMLSINEFQIFPFKILAMDFEHVISSLKEAGVSETIHGVIGADLMDESKAIIDYANKHLYLMMK